MKQNKTIQIYRKYAGKHLRNIPKEEREAVVQARKAVRKQRLELPRRRKKKIPYKMQKALERYAQGESLEKALEEYDRPITVRDFLRKKTAIEELPKAIQIRQAGQQYVISNDLPTRYIDTLTSVMENAENPKDKSDAAYKLHKVFMDYLNDQVPEMLRQLSQTNITNIITVEGDKDINEQIRKKAQELFLEQEKFIDVYPIDLTEESS